MIVLLKRNEILKLNSTFGAFVLENQDAKYNPSLDYNKYKPGMMYVENSEKSRYVSQEECDRWNQEAFEKYEQRRDKFDTISLKGKYKGEVIYNFPKAAINDYINNLASGLVELFSTLNWQAVIFLLDYPTPWLSQDNIYTPVKDALNYCRTIGIDDKFNGGVKANGEELKEFLAHLFWIIRCNASLPQCYFSGIDTDFVACICKYGNVHFSFYSEKARLGVEGIAKELGMIELKDGRCISNFTDNDAIGGRQILV